MTASLALVPAHVARTTIAKHSKSFALASKLLGPRLRDETSIVYTWCRRADDAIDNATSTFDSREELLRLNRELQAAYLGVVRDPVLAEFGRVAKARAIPQRYPAELLAGMSMDTANTRYATFDDLFLYCYRVAGVVGLMMSHIFGVRDDRALVHAAHLGIAMQLTNICRDVHEDWQRGRLYIPDELLATYGARGLADELERRASQADDVAPLADPETVARQGVRGTARPLRKPLPDSARAPLAASIAELLAIADRYYASADEGMSALPWRAAVAVRSARGIYSDIGREIAAREHDPLAPRAVVPQGRKLTRVAAAAVRSAVELPWRMFTRRARVPAIKLEVGDVPRL